MEIYFPAVFEQMSIGIACADLNSGDWLKVNPKVCEITGYTRKELLSTTFQAITCPEDLPECLALTDSLAKGEVSGYTIDKRYIHKNGFPVWVHLTVSLIRDEKNDQQYLFGIIENIEERKRSEAERHNLLLREQRAREEAELTRQQLIESQQRLQYLNYNLEAIVAQRTEALRQLNTELQRSNQELENFAYIASHDLQEPLRKIQAFGNLLEDEYGAIINEGKAYLNRIRDAAGRMRALIDDLLIYSRVATQGQLFTQVDLTTIVDEVIDDLEPRLKATQGHIEVGELPTIEADPQQMYQLFQNLLVNAVKFHRSGIPPLVRVYARLCVNPVDSGQGEGKRKGEACTYSEKFTVGTEQAQESEAVGTQTGASPIPTAPVHNPTFPAAKQHYQIFIEDNGIGFDEKYTNRIFTVFQRLHGKSEYEGTGIGLAIVRTIIVRHGGKITASSMGKAPHLL